MCQLIFVNTGRTTLTKLLTLNLLIADSKTSNKDGYGIFSNRTSLLKYGEAASESEVIAKAVNSIIVPEPVIAHVRLATSSVGSTRVVSAENSHPFESADGNIILAHNGILSFKEKEKEKDYVGMVDSKAFAELLAKTYSEQTEKDTVKALQDSMIHFYGKFALLIYNKAEDSFYICRGKADLHASQVLLNGKPKGFVVNTDKYSLKMAMIASKDNYEIVFPGSEVNFTEPQMLDSETIYKVVGWELQKVGELKEGFFYQTPSSTTYIQHGTKSTVIKNTSSNVLPSKIEELADLLIDLRESLYLNFFEFEELIYATYGCGSAYLTETQVEFLVKVILPALDKRNSEKKIQYWLENYNDFVTLSNKGNLKFPYMMNHEANLKGMINFDPRSVAK